MGACPIPRSPCSHRSRPFGPARPKAALPGGATARGQAGQRGSCRRWGAQRGRGAAAPARCSRHKLCRSQGTMPPGVSAAAESPLSRHPRGGRGFPKTCGALRQVSEHPSPWNYSNVASGVQLKREKQTSSELSIRTPARGRGPHFNCFHYQNRLPAGAS